MTRGWFEWESEGYPFWSNLHHTQTYWNYRDLPNFLFLHYNDMLKDLEGAVRQIVDFADIDCSGADIDRVVVDNTFVNARTKAVDAAEDGDTQKPFSKARAA